MKKQTLYVPLALAVVCVWGVTFVSTKLLLEVLSPIQIMLLRYGIAYLALLAIHPKFHRSEGLRQEVLCFLAALCGSTLYFLAENTALARTQASNVSLLISAAPILTSVVAHLFTRDERLTRRAWYGFGFAMCGIFLVVFNGHFVLHLSPAGDLLALGAALLWAFYSILLRYLHTVHPPVYTTRRMFFYSLLTMAPLALLDPHPFDPALLLRPVVFGNLLFLGVAPSSACYVAWYHVVEGMGAVRANNFVYLNPLVTMIASVIVLHERITWLMGLGALLILLGVVAADGTLLRRRSDS